MKLYRVLFVLILQILAFTTLRAQNHPVITTGPITNLQDITGKNCHKLYYSTLFNNQLVLTGSGLGFIDQNPGNNPNFQLQHL